jgi:hypothetical protein
LEISDLWLFLTLKILVENFFGLRSFGGAV